MDCKILLRVEDISLEKWSYLVYNSKLVSFFQTRECFDFYESISFLQPFCVAIEVDNDLKGVVVGYVIKEGGGVKQFFSRRAIIIGGPLLADDISAEELELLLCTVKNILRNKVIYVESRNFNDYSKYKETFDRCGFVYNEHLNFHVDTSSMEVFQANMGKSRKRDVKTSLRDGAEVIYSPTLEQVKEYYLILDDLYKTKVKTPLFGFEFFEKLYACKSAKFILIKLNDEIIGGTVCVCLDGIGVYEWFACGKDGKYKNIYPSTLATYSGIEYAVQHSYPLFDMMGAGKPTEDYGVRDFKSKFGGILVEYGRFINILNPFLYWIGKKGVQFLKSRK